MAGTLTRWAKLELSYRGVDLGGACVQVEFVDHADGALDELCVTLEDREHRWQGPWLPRKSDRLAAAIVCRNWFEPGDAWRLDLGSFEISELQLSGPPDMVSIRALSARVSHAARTQRKTKAHENKDLFTIASEVAAGAGLALRWEGANPFYERVDQREEGDLPFLARLCRDAGNGLKVAGEKLIVYEGRRWDQRGPHATLKRGEAWIKGYRFTSGTHDQYCGCVVSYWHPQLKELIVGSYFPDDAPETGEVLRLNQPVRDEAEAGALAQAALRNKNRWEVQAEITLVGDPRRRATDVVVLEGFGRFDGRYFLDEVRHILDGQGGFETHLTGMRKVLGY